MKPTIKLSETKRLLTRKKIEAVAKKIFFKKGYAETTMDKIAEQAGISKGAVYLYFKNKNDLFVSLMLPTVFKLGKKLEEFENKLPEFKNSEEVMGEYFKIHKELYKSDLDGIKIIQALQQNDIFLRLPTEAIKKFTMPAKANYETSRRIIIKAQKQGALAKTNTYQLADVLWGSFLGVAQVEENKKILSNKDHTFSTLDFLKSLLSKALDRGGKEDL